MPDPEEQPHDQPENTYVIDTENAAEMARLMRLDQLLTSGMGGSLAGINLDGVQSVLDIACGPGGWALDVAYTYSDIEVVGVDISKRMIAYANAQAQVQQRPNIRFYEGDILRPLNFPDSSFDLVNARLISSFIQRDRWPLLFREVLRVLRPGGIMRLTELEVGMSNKPNFEQAFFLGQQAMHKTGLNFSPNGNHYGIIHMLPHLFRQAGLPILGENAYFIDFSFGTPAHDSFYQELSAALQLFETIVTRTQMATKAEWNNLIQKGLAEMFEEDFCSGWILLSVWGEKPL